jgi:integrase/recombinase XerD
VVDFVAVARRKMKGKTAGRTVPLHGEAKAAVGEWLGAMRGLGLATSDEAPLFQSKAGRRKAISYRKALEVIQEAAERAGVSGPIGMHSFRKAFAQTFYERSGRDLMKTRDAMGHKSVNSTTYYLASCSREVQETILGMWEESK